MAKMSGNAFKCLMYVIRQTRGWHKQSDSIAVSAFVAKCGMSKNTALGAIKELVTLGLVKQVRGIASTALNVYSLTELFDFGGVESVEPASANPEPVQNLHGANSDSASAKIAPPSAKIAPVASAKIAPTKDILFKNTLQKTNTKDIPQTPPSKNQEQQESFDEFWQAYPKKVGKAEALKAFAKLKPDRHALQTMLDALAWQRELADWRKEAGRFVPNPATWLNKQRWEDEPPAARSRTKTEPSLEDIVRQSYENKGAGHERQNLLE